MATPEDLRRIALSFPGVTPAEGPQLAYGLTVKGKHKGICWEWNERVHPKKPKRPNPEVYAFRVRHVGMKPPSSSGPDAKYVHDPHYDGYPAVLVRLSQVSPDELAELFEEGYRCFSP